MHGLFARGKLEAGLDRENGRSRDRTSTGRCLENTRGSCGNLIYPVRVSAEERRLSRNYVAPGGMGRRPKSKRRLEPQVKRKVSSPINTPRAASDMPDNDGRAATGPCGSAILKVPPRGGSRRPRRPSVLPGGKSPRPSILGFRPYCRALPAGIPLHATADTIISPEAMRARSRIAEGGIMAKKSGGSGRVERDAGSGRYVPKGTEKRRPSQTVTEPQKPKKK